MFADGRSCDFNYKYPDILKEGKCVTEKQYSGDNEIIDETTNLIECKNKANQGKMCYLKTSDGRRCVETCLPTKQIEKQLPHSSSK